MGTGGWLQQLRNLSGPGGRSSYARSGCLVAVTTAARSLAGESLALPTGHRNWHVDQDSVLRQNQGGAKGQL